MISMQYPRKKLSRIKNPFQSSQQLDSEYGDSRMRRGDNVPIYDEKKFPNVFQFNDRSRVMVSQSDLASSINDGSGENIHNFSSYIKKQQQKVQQIDSESQFSQHSSNFYEDQKDNRFSFNPTEKFQTQYQQQKHNFDKQKTIIESSKYSQQETPQKTKQKINDTPQINKFTISQKPSLISATHQGYDSQVSSFSKIDSMNKQTSGNKQSKKTFKPKFFQQFQQEIQYQPQIVKLQTTPKTNYQNKLPKQTTILPQKLKCSNNAVQNHYQNEFKQEVQDQKIHIFVPHKSQNQSLFVKDKLKAKILNQQKMNLSAGSQVHSQTQNILDHLRDQIISPNEQIQINLQTYRNSQRFKKDLHTSKKMVESKMFLQENTNFSHNEKKIQTAKKPRRKIFESKTENNNNDRKYVPENRSPYVSQFDRNPHSKQRDPSPSQILMKSLNIIDKMANKKTYQNQKQLKHTTQSVVIVPSTSFKITQSPSNSINILTPSQQQLGIQRQILELNFEISSFQTTFDIEKFDRKDQVNKIKILNDASIELFEKYKNLILSQRLIDSQNTFHSTLKQQILRIRESITKILNFQQKYIQTKYILSSFEEQIKNILLLDSRQKYKKIKLLNEAIQVMGKTETYLSLEIGKISVIIKSFITREKILLEQLRDWLKQCISKQNSI